MKPYLLGLTMLLFSVFSTGSAGAQQARTRVSAGGAEQPKAPAEHGNAKSDQGEEEEPPFKVEGGGKVAAGWTARVDRNAPLTKIKFESTPTGWHARTAASVMLFRSADVMSGNYRVTVTMAQTEGSPGHAEPYGLLLGGSGLSGDAARQRYTSFVIRGDGKFQIRRRADGKGTDVTNGSVNSKALHQMDEKGRCSNELTVVAGAADVRFLVNGTEVYRAKRAEVDTDGLVALRVSHNLDVNISAFQLTQG